jgi:hypothetical protein
MVTWGSTILLAGQVLVQVDQVIQRKGGSVVGLEKLEGGPIESHRHPDVFEDLEVVPVERPDVQPPAARAGVFDQPLVAAPGKDPQRRRIELDDAAPGAPGFGLDPRRGVDRGSVLHHGASTHVLVS